MRNGTCIEQVIGGMGLQGVDIKKEPYWYERKEQGDQELELDF